MNRRAVRAVDAAAVGQALRRRVGELRAVAMAASPLDRLAPAGEAAELDTLRRAIEALEGAPEQAALLDRAREVLSLA